MFSICFSEGFFYNAEYKMRWMNWTGVGRGEGGRWWIKGYPSCLFHVITILLVKEIVYKPGYNEHRRHVWNPSDVVKSLALNIKVLIVQLIFLYHFSDYKISYRTKFSRTKFPIGDQNFVRRKILSNEKFCSSKIFSDKVSYNGG